LGAAREYAAAYWSSEVRRDSVVDGWANGCAGSPVAGLVALRYSSSFADASFKPQAAEGTVSLVPFNPRPAIQQARVARISDGE